MNMFLHELKMHRKSTIIWTISMVSVIVVFMSIYPSFANNAPTIKQLLLGFPIEVRKALNISVDMISSLLGFYSYIFMYVSLCGAIQAMNIGLSILSKEDREKTVDFLLTKPVSRQKIITSKLLAALTCIVITDVVFIVCSYFMSMMVAIKSFDIMTFFMISITLFFIQAMFISLGLIISVLAKKIKSVISVSLGIVFGFFVIAMFGSVIGDTASKYLTPFKYFVPDYIVANKAYDFPFAVTAIAIVVVSIAASYVVYIKKDIHNV